MLSARDRMDGRDGAWFLAGLGAGLGLACAVGLRRRTRRPAGPRCLPAPQRVVELPGVLTIDEHCGHASNGDSTVSVASVNVTTACTEATQVPGFDEYVLVHKGKMSVRVSSTDVSLRPKAHRGLEPFVVEASAGQMLWLPKGYLYTYTFPGPCAYVPVCLPAFSPEISGRLS